MDHRKKVALGNLIESISSIYGERKSSNMIEDKNNSSYIIIIRKEHL